jgi:hypothetical protein
MKLFTCPTALLMIFLLTLPLVNPWVRGDGVGYYAYVRSLLVQHNLRFEDDWLHSNWPYVSPARDAIGHIGAEYTRTGHLANRYAVGASMLWTPFLVPVHLVMLTLGKAGVSVRADGFSKPYRLAMALATALYGFVGLAISFRLASFYVRERWAFLAALGMWFASSLTVYMYFNPSYSHAHSVFVVAVFLWYWHRTRLERTLAQWAILGLLSGMMLDVYYPNIAVLLVPLLESLRRYWLAWRAPGHNWEVLRRLLAANVLYACLTLLAFSPSLITRQIIYGHPWDSGYGDLAFSHGFHPALWQPLLSSNHGLLSWTPIVLPALVGLALFRKYDRELATYSLATLAALYGIVACHPEWHGASSYGNRFFVSLTPFFVLGLAVTLHEAARGFKRGWTAMVSAGLAIGVLILWNLAFIFQWGTGLVPHVGPISWKQMACNQIEAVPRRLGSELKFYFTNRGKMMQQIGCEDVQRKRHESIQPCKE